MSEKSMSAKDRIRQILEEQIAHANSIVDLMEKGVVMMREHNKDITTETITKEKLRAQELAEALERLDSLALIIGREKKE